MKGIAAVAGIAAFGAVSATVLAPSASADGTWGAFAYSPTNGVIGAGWNYPTKQEAKDRAMQECANRPPLHPEHPSQCKVVASGPAACWALAAGPRTSSYSAGYGATMDEAEQVAMSHSSAGQIVARFWNSGGEPGGASRES